MGRIVIATVVSSWATLWACNPGVSQASPPESERQQSPPSATGEAALATIAVSAVAKSPDVSLPIPARDHAPERPEEGWCAETAIQEALLHFGAFVPQSAINRAGEPRNPDLYWSDVPVAMKALGLKYRGFGNSSDGDNMTRFLDWIETQVDAGRPVIAGVKIHPTEHPEWGLDHMVLIVGHDRGEALYINTTWGYRQRFTRAELAGSDRGIAFHNGRGRYFAYAIHGLRASRRDPAVARMKIESESESELRVALVASNLRVGATYELTRHRAVRGKSVATETFVADGSERRMVATIDKSRSALFRYRLVKAPD